MTAFTDDERREVAERLRGLHDYETANVIVRTCLGLRPGMLMDKGTRRRMGDFIADLIDPDCEEGRYSVARTVRPVDRDALLALAKVLGGMGDRYNEHERYELGTTFKAIARRIREACGEVVE